MMEQLAERRMQREEETYQATLPHQSMHSHGHPPPLDDDDYEDEDEEEYDSQDDEEYEEDEMVWSDGTESCVTTNAVQDAMTEEQRMEEGRRMFQIFAARMFEQRVLHAYREKVAMERQQRLIEELEEDDRLKVEREAKKARDAQKKKEKKKQQKQAKEEERARKEAEKAAELAAIKAAEEKKQEELRLKREEQKRKKEAEKKAQEEERARKEAEKQRRLQEERERVAEAERKAKEQKEREKKKREEAKKKEREEREAREKEARERKAKEDSEKKAREEQARKDREAKARARQEEHSTPHVGKRASQPGLVHIPPGLTSGPPIAPSPHLQIATPAIPKAPTPVRPRQASQQGSHTSSPRSSVAGIDTSASPGKSLLSQDIARSSVPQALQQSQPSAPMSPVGAERGAPFGFGMMPGMNGLPTSTAPMLPSIGQRTPFGHDLGMMQNQPGLLSGQFRGFGAPNGLPMPTGINGHIPMNQGRNASVPFQPQAPGTTPGRSQPHSRQQSASLDRSSLDLSHGAQPIARPAPIKRPSSPTQDQSKTSQKDVDDLSAQFGSSALLEDSDVAIPSNAGIPISSTPLASLQGAGRGFNTSLYADNYSFGKHDLSYIGSPGTNSTWGTQNPFGAPGLSSSPSWGASPGSTWPTNAFGSMMSTPRPRLARPLSIRLTATQACRQIMASSQKPPNGYINCNTLLRQVESMRAPADGPLTVEQLLEICDTEGNAQNGGGSFVIRYEGSRGTFVKYEPDTNMGNIGRGGMVSVGDIGSPVPGVSHPVPGARLFGSMSSAMSPSNGL